MPQITNWQVKVGKYSGGSLATTDHASRTLGLFIDQQCDPGQLGTGTCAVTLDNRDGALNPDASGSFNTEDWLEYGIFIDCTVTGAVLTDPVPVFHGVITDFRIDDDGDGRSTVTVTGQDVFSVIGRQQGFTFGMTNTSTADQLFDMTNPASLLNSTKVPTIGYPTMRTFWEELNASTESVAHNLPASAGSFVLGDAINNSVMPNEQTVAFPTILDDSGTYVANDSWVGFTVDGLARAGVSATGNAFVFTTNDPMPTGQLPYRRLVRDFHIDLITNAAEVTALDGGTAQSFADTTSQEKFGTRARSYRTTSTSDARALYTAQLWVNRYSYDESVVMSASSLQVTDSMIQGFGGDLAKWRSLLDVTAGWWQTGSVAYTPTGGSSITYPFIIAGRRIEATPTDTVVTLKVRPQSIYLAFILDDATRGVLDANKLG
jgi:hypothetical protein